MPIMDPNHVHEELFREPFTPLRLHLSDGRQFDIRNPDEAVVSGQSLYVFKLRRDQRRMSDDTRLINMVQIVSIERVEKPKASPKGSPGGKGPKRSI